MEEAGILGRISTPVQDSWCISRPEYHKQVLWCWIHWEHSKLSEEVGLTHAVLAISGALNCKPKHNDEADNECMTGQMLYQKHKLELSWLQVLFWSTIQFCMCEDMDSISQKCVEYMFVIYGEENCKQYIPSWWQIAFLIGEAEFLFFSKWCAKKYRVQLIEKKKFIIYLNINMVLRIG